MPAKKGLSKGLLWGIIGGSIGLVLLVVGLIVAWSFFVPNKADYTEASKTVESISKERFNLTSKLSSLQFGLSGTPTTDTVFNNDVEAAEKSLEQMKTDLEELKQSKAIRSGESKDKFSEMETKLTESITWYENALTSFKDSRVVLKDCSSTSYSSSQLTSVRSAMTSCANSLKGVKDLKNSDVKEFISRAATFYEEALSIIDKIASIPERDMYGSRYGEFSSLSEQWYDLSDDISDISRDFNSNFEKHSKEIDPATSITQLNEALYQAAAKK